MPSTAAWMATVARFGVMASWGSARLEKGLGWCSAWCSVEERGEDERTRGVLLYGE